MIRILITGATGFIGRHCLQRLLIEDCEIHAASRLGTGLEGERIAWHAADLSDPDAARRLVAKVRPSHLLHLAWALKPGVYMNSPDNLQWLQASLALAAAFGEAHGRRFVGVGSAAEYEAGHARCSEDLTPIRPAWIYGKCKAACWAGIEAAAECYGFSAAWGRVFLAYGPGDSSERLIPSLIGAFNDKRPIPTTDGGQFRDFIYAADAADLLVRLLFASEEGTFNVGTGHPTAIRAVIEEIADRFGARDLVRIGAIERREGEQAALVADMTKVRARLGWEAPTSIAAGISRVLATG